MNALPELKIQQKNRWRIITTHHRLKKKCFKTQLYLLTLELSHPYTAR